MTKIIDKKANILKAAKALGATDYAIDKWRLRGVPPKWQIAIFQKTKGKIKIVDFAVFGESQ